MYPLNKNEQLFTDVLNATTSELYHAERFHSEMVDQIYPLNKEVDSLLYFPMIPRNETTKEGMLHATAHVMEQTQFIDRADRGRYKLNPSAKHRTISQYGDLLTDMRCQEHHEMFHKQKTMLGMEDHVKTMLTADCRKFMEHDYLHEGFHRLKAIYEDSYGGLIQPAQAERRVKRVQLDPLKGQIADHDKHANICYDALVQLRLEAFVKSYDMQDFIGGSKNNREGLIELENAFAET